MMNIDNVNLILTIVSIVVTVISKQYKTEACMLKDTIDLKSLTSNFIVESQHFLKLTRTSDWFRGIDVNTVTSPFISVLMSFASSYHLMSNSEDIKVKVHKLTCQVQDYEKLDFKSKKKCQDLIFEIAETMQEEVQKSAKKIIC